MSERTYQPTPRHLDELRRQGAVAMSTELIAGLVLLAAVYLLNGRMGTVTNGLGDIMRRSIVKSATLELTPQTVLEGGSAILNNLSGTWLSFFGALVAVGLVSGLAQTRGQISLNHIVPSFKHVNPIEGLKRIFSTRGAFEVAKGLIKMGILGLLFYQNLRDLPPKLIEASQIGLSSELAVIGDALANVARQAAILLVGAAALDFIYQWRQHRQRTLMTREEMVEEQKSSEGQPFIKAKIRQLQRRMSQQRMMQELTHADVVVTNPTHLAIALRYDREKMAAPVVVAKGRALMAERIVKRSRELRIPIVQNIPLAHALIQVELGTAIPVALYQAVAEVLAFVFRLRRQNPYFARRPETAQATA